VVAASGPPWIDHVPPTLPRSFHNADVTQGAQRPGCLLRFQVAVELGVGGNANGHPLREAASRSDALKLLLVAELLGPHRTVERRYDRTVVDRLRQLLDRLRMCL
jgi:hypothetical protein